MLIDKLGLEKHEEGGYFRQTYASGRLVEIAGYSGSRPLGTAIYYLILGDVADPFHRLKSDEIWHFYSGSPLMLYKIDRGGTLSKTRMGNDILSGDAIQLVLEAGSWFGAEVEDKSSYSLVGCTVCPGFDPDDFEFGKKKALLKLYPSHRPVIERLSVI